MGSLGALLKHPEDLPALLKMKIASARAGKLVPSSDPDLAFCYTMLNRVSRSFAFVIQQLGPELRNAGEEKLVKKIETNLVAVRSTEHGLLVRTERSTTEMRVSGIV